YNRVNSVQTFIGFANSRYIFSSVNGFLNYVANDSNYVECSNGSTSLTGACPGGTSITGPVLLYLQQAGVNRSVRDAGTQHIPQTELHFYVQDTWKPNSNWTLNYGLRWSAQLAPSILSPKDSPAYHSLFGSSGTIPFGLPAPSFPNLFPSTIPLSAVFAPSVFVFDKNFRNPRTLNITIGYEKQVAADLGLMLSFTHAHTDFVSRFINRN